MKAAEWIGTICQVGGVFSLSSREVAPPLAFAIMLVGSSTWTGVAVIRRDWPLVALNVAFSASNILGVYQWLAFR